MLNKVVFLCVNSRENFLPPVSQSYSKDYYERFKKLLIMKNIKFICREFIDIYGGSEDDCKKSLFLEECEKFQLLYVQSDKKDFLATIFQTADLVITGLSGSRSEFEKTYMSIFPWQDEALFLWGSHIGRDSNYIARLSRECMLRKEQFVEIGENWEEGLGAKKLPPFCGSLKMYCYDS